MWRVFDVVRARGLLVLNDKDESRAVFQNNSRNVTLRIMWPELEFHLYQICFSFCHPFSFKIKLNDDSVKSRLVSSRPENLIALSLRSKKNLIN